MAQFDSIRRSVLNCIHGELIGQFKIGVGCVLPLVCCFTCRLAWHPPSVDNPLWKCEDTVSEMLVLHAARECKETS